MEYNVVISVNQLGDAFSESTTYSTLEVKIFRMFSLVISVSEILEILTIS